MSSQSISIAASTLDNSMDDRSKSMCVVSKFAIVRSYSHIDRPSILGTNDKGETWKGPLGVEQTSKLGLNPLHHMKQLL